MLSAKGSLHAGPGRGVARTHMRARASHVGARRPSARSEMTPEGRRATRLDEILLNGNNVAIMVPGGQPPYME